MKFTYDSLEDIIIFDDLISPAYQDWLFDMVSSESFMWRRSDKTVTKDKKYLNDKRNGFANVCSLFEGKLNLTTFKNEDDDFISHTSLNCFMPLILEFIEKLNVNLMSRIKIKATPAIGINQIQLPHIDQVTLNSWNIIYYFNDTDGDTIIYNERTNCLDQLDFLLSKDVWTIKQRVSPKKGRAVAFKGDLFHSASYPKYEPRFILNINLSENYEQEERQNFLEYN